MTVLIYGGVGYISSHTAVEIVDAGTKRSLGTA